MITKIKKPCVNCGADKPSDYTEYDGMLGYEAIICKRCGWIYDQNGNYPTDDWSKTFIKERRANG